MIGALVDGRYKILAAMASGSMGAVYKAERVPIGKLVAVKFLHASFANDAEFLARFERETRVMSKLAHPNCVSVVDFGVFEQAPYIVMDFVDGVTLRAILDDEIPAVPRALSIARQIAAGLAHAHAQGIIHRDVKPANIMISEAIGAGEVVRILDFGLARLRGPGGGRDPTQANTVVGTPNYMAPEQTIAGGTLDARTDIYAVGVVLFEMLTGERPFTADDTPSILQMHRSEAIPRLADRAPERGSPAGVAGRGAQPGDVVKFPKGLQALIDTAMAKDPDDRYQSAIELATALESLSVEITTGTVRALPPRDDSESDTAVAPTMLDIGTAPIRKKGGPRASSRLGIALLGVLVLGGGAAVYLARSGASGGDPERVAVVADAPRAVPVSVDAAVVPIDAVEAMIQLVDAPELGDGGVDAGSDGGSAGGTEPIEIEMEPDPLTAEDLAPVDPTAVAATDEAEDAPTEAPVDEPAAAPVLATSVHDAVVLIKKGEKDLALQSLRALWKKQPNSGYIPFLLGNLYFDKRWWSVSMDHYRTAIAKNAGYKKNQVLQRNIIRMLGSSKTMTRAEVFLRRTVGKAALPALQRAAKSDANATVKKRAAAVAKQLR